MLDNETIQQVENDVNFDNERTLAENEEAEEIEEIEQEGAVCEFTANPVLEYGTPQLCYVNRVQAVRKVKTIKPVNNEYETEKKQESRFFRFYFKVVEPPLKSDFEYRFCTSREQGNGLLKLLKNSNNGIPLFYGTFEPVEIEVEEKDKKTGKPTGRYVKIVVPNITNYEKASKGDIKAVVKMAQDN